MPHLTMLTGATRGRVIVLGDEPCRLGRDAGLEVQLNDAKASRIHAEISLKDDQWIFRDLKSKNGTLVNGTAVTALILREGDQIQIGETKLAFSLQAAPVAQPPGGARLDSMAAPRLPVGAIPALGSAGVNSRGGETFETLELTAPLGLLSAEASSGPPAQTLERANSALRALYALARTAAEANSTAALWSALSEGLQAVLEADRVTPILLDEKGQWEALPARKVSGPEAAFTKIPVSRTIVDYALRTRRSVLTVTRTDARFGQAKSVGEQGITCALCVPVISHEKVLGLVYADRMGGEDFTHADQELLTAACLQAAPALENLGRLEQVLAQKQRLLEELKTQHNLLGDSPALRAVTGFIQRAAPSQSVVLVLGESGTGKELVARAIHYNSQRSAGPFVVVNCAALTETLIESELFGHVKGAFTGATNDRAGRFEMAHEGTLFLDEIGELSNTCQTKLLRVLEQGELSRVGEGRVRKVDVRVVAATNRDLPAEVRSGRFREDLYYRLNVLAFSLPPLRDRGADIELLLQHYLTQAALRSGRARLEFSEEARAVLLAYRWPGNVRELRNLTERLAVLCPHEVLGLADLPLEVHSSAARTPVADGPQPSAPNTPPPAETETPRPAPAGENERAGGAREGLKLAEIERQHVLRVLASCDQNKKLAAERLGIDRSTLYAKLRAYGILT